MAERWLLAVEIDPADPRPARSRITALKKYAQSSLGVRIVQALDGPAAEALVALAVQSNRVSPQGDDKHGEAESAGPRDLEAH